MPAKTQSQNGTASSSALAHALADTTPLPSLTATTEPTLLAGGKPVVATTPRALPLSDVTRLPEH